MTPFLAQVMEDHTLRPAHRFLPACKRDLVPGDWVRVEVVEERSAKSHNHFFAQLNDMWHSLPEGISADLPSVEHLRKWALIATGYSNDRRIAAPSPRVANEIAAIARTADEFAVVEVAGTVVIVRQAKSQNRASMGKQAFGESKQAVLDYVAGLIGTSADDLRKHAEAEAA